MSDEIVNDVSGDAATDARAGDVEVKQPARASRFDIASYTQVNAEVAAEILASRSPKEIVADLEEIIANACTFDRQGNSYPDFRTRLAAQQLRLHYLLGKPIERQQVINANVGPTDSDLIERLAHSPALRAAIREAVEAAEKTSV